MRKQLTTKQVLQEVYKLLRAKKRWTKGEYARTKTGKETGPLSRHATCWCIRGAIYKVTGASANPRTALPDAYLHADQALHRALPRGIGGVAGYNDKDSTTHEDVLAVIRAAIKSVK